MFLLAQKHCIRTFIYGKISIEDVPTITAKTKNDCEFSLYTNGNYLFVEGDVIGQEINIYSTNGFLIYKLVIKNNRKVLNLESGVYIVRIGRVAKKVLL